MQDALSLSKRASHFERRLRRGDHLFVVSTGTEIASMAWLGPRTELRAQGIGIDLKDLKVDVSAGSHIIFDCATSTRFRGRGLYTYVLRKLTRAYSTPGHKLWISCDEKNYASRKVIERSGFAPEMAITRIRVCGVTLRPNIKLRSTRVSSLPRRLNATPKLRLINSASSLRLFDLANKLMQRHGQIVFTLHRVLPREELRACYNPILSITPESLDALLTFLAKRLAVIGLSELLQSRTGAPACAFTFDDGWEDNFRVALPIFKAHSLPATIFLVTDLIGGTQLLPEERFANVLAGPDRMKCVNMLAEYAKERNMQLSPTQLADDAALARFFKLFSYDVKMKVLAACEENGKVAAKSSFLTWDQAREMQKYRFSFASHTRRHASLSVNTRDFVMEELVGSKQKLQVELGVDSRYFAYPNGMYSHESAQAVADAGYLAAFTTDVGVISDQSDAYRLPRMHVADEIVNDLGGHFSPPLGQLLLTRAYLAKSKSFPPVASNSGLVGKRILFMIDVVDEQHVLGGTELQVRQIISTLSAAGAKPQLCIVKGQPWATASDYFDCPVHFACLDGGGSLHRFSRALALIKWMRSQDLAAIQTFFSDSNLFGPVLAWLARIPIRIGSRRNLNYWMSVSWRFFQSIANLFVTHIIANAQAVVENTRKTEAFMGSKACVLYNGLDIERFKRNADRRAAIRAQLGLTAEHVLIGTVSNLRPVKGLPDFIEAAGLAARDYPQARFAVIGEGPLLQELERMIADRGLTGKFRLLGRQSDVPGYLSSFDIAVHSSESEGFSNSVLEYIGAGLPVVATNVGGNAEALEDAGILVPAKDAPALAQGLKALLADPDRRASLGSAASVRATMFAPGPTRERLLQTYSKILQA